MNLSTEYVDSGDSTLNTKIQNHIDDSSVHGGGGSHVECGFVETENHYKKPYVETLSVTYKKAFSTTDYQLAITIIPYSGSMKDCQQVTGGMTTATKTKTGFSIKVCNAHVYSIQWVACE